MNSEEVHEVLAETMLHTAGAISHKLPNNARATLQDLQSYAAVQRVLITKSSATNARDLTRQLIERIREKLVPVQKELAEVPDAAQAIQELLDFAVECHNELYIKATR